MFTNLEEALAHIKAQDATIVQKDKDLAAALAEVSTLSSKLDLQEKHGKDALIVTVGKKSYKITGNRFTYEGANHSAEELSKNQAQLKRMIEKGSGSVTLID